MAINAYSKILRKKLQDGELQITTREENGCGTGLLIDWAIAWMHLNYSSKAVILLDADKEGKTAKKSIDGEKNQIKKISK